MKRLLLTLVVLTAAGCANNRAFDTAGVDTELTPRLAAAEAIEGRQVVWGGVIVDTTNLGESTRIEVLSYPLGRDQKPQTDRAQMGRFYIEQSGFLEPADYAPGRRVTVKGTLEGVSQGRVGQAAYTYPVVEATELELWPERVVREEPRVNFGIGIGIGL